MVGIRGRIDLNWSAPSNVSDVDGFRIFRSTDGGVTYALRDAVADPAARTWAETGLADATKYTYRVRAYSDDAGSSYTTNKVSVVTTLPAPSDVGVSLIGGTSAFVSWTASPASTTTGYSIYKLSPGSSAQLVGQVAANATSFQVTGLTESTEYRLLVQANSSTGGQDSAFATSEIITTLPPGVPIAATNLSAAATSDGRRVQLSWDDNSADETGFVIMRKSGDGPWQAVQQLPAGTTQYMDTGLYSLTEYQYKVEAQGPGGGSPSPESVNVLTEYGDGVVYRGSPSSAQSFDGVTASWEGDFDRQDPPLQNDSISLTLDDLPDHYALQVSFFGGAVNAGHTYTDSDTLTLTGLGSGDVQVFTGREAFLWDLNVTADHADNSVTLTIEGTDFESGEVWWNPTYATDGWGIDGVEVKLLRNRVGVEVVAEDDFAGEATDPDSGIGTNRGRFRFERTGDLSAPLTAYFNLSGSASGGDYQASSSGSVTFGPNEASVDVIITPTDDQSPEWTETVVATVEEGPGYTTEQPSSAVVEIVDDDLRIDGLPAELALNNDDDDGDGVSDRAQTGTVADENDLYAVQLDFPEEVNYGASVEIAAPSDKVRVWQNADRSGTPLIDGAAGTFAWTIGVDTPPREVFVEAIAGSAVVGDIQITLRATDAFAAPVAPTRPSTTQATTQQATARGLSIWSMGADKEVQNVNAGSVIVGSRIWLLALPEGPESDQATYSWSVGGTAIAGYEANNQTASVQRLEGDAIHRAGFTFYWVSGSLAGTDTEVALEASFGGKTERQKTMFSVLRPEAKVETNTSAPILAGDFISAGARFDRTEFTLPPTFSGTTQWVQLVDSTTERKFVIGGWKKPPRPSGFGLDGAYPYDAEPAFTIDNPRTELNQAAFTEVNWGLKFKMYLMFKPDGDAAIWVPLRAVSWETSASARVNNANGWDLINPASTPDPGDADELEHPVWSFNSGDYLNLPEDQWEPL